MSESAAVVLSAEQGRRAYVVPTLVVYGNLVDLTATGSVTNANESNSGSMCESTLAKMSGACGNP